MMIYNIKDCWCMMHSLTLRLWHNIHYRDKLKDELEG
jgi:hypothetical protein